MTIKLTLITPLLFNLMFLSAQRIAVDDMLGEWVYLNSQDSISERWVSFVENDLTTVLNEENNSLLTPEEQEETFGIIQLDSNAPLLLKDTRLVIKVFPAINYENQVRFSFLEYPLNADAEYKYIDYSMGDLKGEIITEEATNTLSLTNYDKQEDYKILTIDKTNLVLLHMDDNTKHLFKRKQ